MQHIDGRQNNILENIAKSKRSFLDMLKSAPDHDLDALEQERTAVRPDAEAIMKAEITKKTGMPVQETLYDESRKAAEKELKIHQEKTLGNKEKEKKKGQKTR